MEVRVMGKRSVVGVLLALTFGFTITGYAQEVDRSISLEHYQALQLPLLLQLPDQTYLLGVTDVEGKRQKTDKPPLNAIRITGEILAGEVGGIGGAVAGFAVGFVMDYAIFVSLLEIKEPEGLMPCTVIGAVAGYTFGTAGGVYLVGSIGNETGSFWAALAGSSVGIMGIWVWGLGPPIGATIAFNLTRRYDSPHTESRTALINFSDGQMSLAVPRVYFRPHPFDAGSLSQSVDLVRVTF
jgi:hypothetical protein